MSFTDGHLLALADTLAHDHIPFWVDGGWCVDLLVGYQTREHEDLDIAIEAAWTERAVNFLVGQGFGLRLDDDSKPWNFVLVHADGRQIDFHVIRIGANGDGVYGPEENGQFYPAIGLTGVGHLDGRELRCIEVTTAMSFRTGFALRSQDCTDLLTFHNQFGLALPPEYDRFCH